MIISLVPLLSENILPLSSWPLSGFWHYWSHLNYSSLVLFGLYGFVLESFKSYLSDGCFCVKCESSFFLSYLPLWCSPEFYSWSSSFVLYTTPLNTLISSVTLNHHLYATLLITSIRMSQHYADCHAPSKHFLFQSAYGCETRVSWLL